jgi:hypothetical protein
MPEYNLDEVHEKLTASLTGTAELAIKKFCQTVPELPKQAYPEAMVGMGYQYESFDMMFALIAYHVQATHDESDYRDRFMTMQNVLQPFCSEYGIEAGRPLANPHRKLYLDFYESVTGKKWPSVYPPSSAGHWINNGRFWADRMINNLKCHGMTSMDRAKYNLGYHWSVEYLSIGEFEQLREGWRKAGFDGAYIQAHCDVEPEHANCATAAIAEFGIVDDALVRRGIRDHEYDLVGFYTENTELVLAEKRRFAVREKVREAVS